MTRPRCLGLLLLVLAGACRMRETQAIARGQQVLAESKSIFGALREIQSPAGIGGGEPFLFTAPDGSVLMSWLERKAPESKRYALKFARWKEGAWSAPRVIAERDDFFVNWADFPSIVAGSGDILFAHWLQKSAKGVYAYDVRIAWSRDDGKTWSSSVVPHRDGTQTEHGFVSMVPRGDSVAAVWLDGRNMKEAEGDHETSGPMTLRYAKIHADGRIKEEAQLDERVCECCPTGMTFTSAGPVVVYRDRSETEIRDVGIVRANSGRWSDPAVLNDDGWQIEGCPVNGPQIDSRGSVAIVGWFTSGGGKSRVYVSFSHDEGSSFSTPIAVDSGNPLGRVDVVLLPDNSALVTWIERVGEGAEVRARRVSRDGKLDDPLKVATSSPARSAGVPRITLAGNEIFFAWTEPEQPPRIRLSVLPLKRG